MKNDQAGMFYALEMNFLTKRILRGKKKDVGNGGSTRKWWMNFVWDEKIWSTSDALVCYWEAIFKAKKLC